MTGTIVILNGAPRSGKSSIAAVIQATFAGVWINLGVDSYLAMTPGRSMPGIGLRPGGERPDLEPGIAAMYAAMWESVAAHARQRLNVVVDVGMHDGYSTPLGIRQEAARRLDGLAAYLVGVRCPLDVLMDRRDAAGEARYLGTTAVEEVPAPVHRWEDFVHAGSYDVEVDTADLSPEQCAAAIRQRIEAGPPAALGGGAPAAADDQALRRLEESLWRRETRYDRDHMEAVLAAGFVEFGRSGRVYDRQAALDAEPQPLEAGLADMAVHMITGDVALVTYRSEFRRGEATEVGNRSSLWRRTPFGWELVFHQGTPV